jgi:hypothetical protein
MVYRHVSRDLVDLLPRLGGADEGPHCLSKDRPLVVEAGSVNGYVAMGQKMGFNNGLEGGFVRLCHCCAPRINRARSRRSISNGVMHLMPRPMQASGILILRVDAEGTSCVTTVSPAA